MKYRISKHRLSFAISSMIAMALLLSATRGLASNFNVFPISVVLSAASKSETVTIHNQSDKPIRFQLSAVTWDQKPNGEMVLNPTDDIIFFPQLLAIDPGQERNIRIGTAVPPAETEKTYRIFVEELPSPEKTQTAGGPSIRILTKMGIPIFLQPSQNKKEAQIADMRMSAGVFHFAIKNGGNVHIAPQTVKVEGFADSTAPVFGRQTNGWYVLSGESREYDLPIPQPECGKIKRLNVEVKTDSNPYSGSFDVPPEACGKSGSGEKKVPPSESAAWKAQ